MPNDEQRIYWDTCVYLSYISGTPDRLPVIQQILGNARQKRAILTSIVSMVEVAYAAHEKNPGPLDPQMEKTMDQLWADDSVTEIVELNHDVAGMARDLIRRATATQRKLKPLDAIQLASAQWMRASEFHTYDRELLTQGFDKDIGCKMCEPYMVAPRLPNM